VPDRHADFPSGLEQGIVPRLEGATCAEVPVSNLRWVPVTKVIAAVFSRYCIIPRSGTYRWPQHAIVDTV